MCVYGFEVVFVEFGCVVVKKKFGVCVFVGGLGFGYMLCVVFDQVGLQVMVIVVEIVFEVVEWNCEYFNDCQCGVLMDLCMCIVLFDVWVLIGQGFWDVIFMDIDNGFQVWCFDGNSCFYNCCGFECICDNFSFGGIFVIWCVQVEFFFVCYLQKVGFEVWFEQVCGYFGVDKSGEKCGKGFCYVVFVVEKIECGGNCCRFWKFVFV